MQSNIPIMKYFKCGKCEAPYKINPAIVTREAVGLVCKKCGAKNVVRLGPVLLIQNKHENKQFPLKLGKFTVGRSIDGSSCDITINDPYVSRNHLEIEVTLIEAKIAVTIQDKGSTNGTFNQHKTKLHANQKYPLSPTDFVIFGLTKLSVQMN